MNEERELKVDASGLSFKELNSLIRNAIMNNVRKIELFNVNGQRYIGDGLKEGIKLTIHGYAGNDLGAFMDGATIVVYGNAGDCVGNTMNSGRIIIHGNVGDVVGYSMRGGEIFVRGNAGYRVGIHMKEYAQSIPIIVVGGSTMDFLGEYMAGGRLIILGIGVEDDVVGDYVATGMHGGKIFVRGEVDEDKLGVGAKKDVLNEQDKMELKQILTKYCNEFGIPIDSLLNCKFTKIVPITHRPYGKIYALH